MKSLVSRVQRIETNAARGDVYKQCEKICIWGISLRSCIKIWVKLEKLSLLGRPATKQWWILREVDNKSKSKAGDIGTTLSFIMIVPKILCVVCRRLLVWILTVPWLKHAKTVALTRPLPWHLLAYFKILWCKQPGNPYFAPVLLGFSQCFWPCNTARLSGLAWPGSFVQERCTAATQSLEAIGAVRIPGSNRSLCLI